MHLQMGLVSRGANHAIRRVRTFSPTYLMTSRERRRDWRLNHFITVSDFQ